MTLQIFSFAHHGIEEMESACLLSHVEVVAVITVCYVFKKAGRSTFLLLHMPHKAGKIRHQSGYCAGGFWNVWHSC